MMNTKNIHLLDVVALTEDLPERGLTRGQYASLALCSDQLMILRYEPILAL